MDWPYRKEKAGGTMPFMSHSRNLRPQRPEPPAGSWPDTVTIRRARAGDEAALARLAALDSHPTLSGPVLVAEVEGDIWAAAEVDGAWVLADPFRPSGELALMVAQRAGDLRAQAARTARREQRRARAAAKVAKDAVAA
jgi:hypothetical protein